MRNANLQEVHANLVSEKLHDDKERQIAGMDYVRRVLLTDPARLRSSCMNAELAEPGK